MSAVVTGGNGGAPHELSKADFQSDQETRWCPGCGDYAVLAAVQQFMPELGIPPEKIVFITGIGCAGRLVFAGAPDHRLFQSDAPAPDRLLHT